MTETKFRGRLIAHQTYINFMKKYNLCTMEIKNGRPKRKPIEKMRAEIYKYETKNTDDIIDGLYYNVPT